MFRLFKKNRDAMKYILAAFLAVMALGMIGVVTPWGDTNRMETGILAEVDGQRVTTQDLLRVIQSQLRNSPYGNDPRIVPLFASRALDEMVLRYGLEAQARRLGLEVSDQELLRTIQAMPWLSPNGQFIGMDSYPNMVQQQTGMSVTQFESELRVNLLEEKLRAVVTDGLRVTSAEVRDEFMRRNAKAKIDYVLFDPSQLLKSVEVTPDKLEAYFKRAPQRYKVPEQRRVRYALIDADAVRAQVKLSDEELRKSYTEHLADYRVPERVKVAHILFKTTGKSDAEIATIQKTAQDVLTQIRSGKDFAELAKKYSEDSSASNGGELGWIVRSQTVKEFEDTAFSMKPGQVSGLVKTIYGIHILKALDKQVAHLETFDEVKQTLRAQLERERLEVAEQSLGSRLETEVKANPSGPSGFEAVAKKAGLELKETPLFRPGQKLPDFGDSESFADLAYQLAQGQAGPPIAVPKGVAVIQVSAIVPEHVPKLDELRARVEEDYRAEESKGLASQKARDFATRAKSGDFAKLAKAEGLKVKESKDFTPQDSVEDLIPGSAVGAAFTMATGQTSDVVSLGTNSVVFRVVSHTPADEAQLAGQQDRIAEELLERKRDLAFEIYRKNLTAELLKSRQLKMNDAAMKQFLATYQKP